MSVAILGSLIIWLIVAVIVIAIVVYFVNWLYRRSSKEVSFVRTGLFGEKVVINSGAFVLPFIHEEVKELLQLLVNVFGLAIRLRVVCGGRHEFDTEEAVELAGEVGDKLWASI